MAKARSGIFDKISGSQGGTQFRQTRYGTVMGIKTVPVNRWSPYKQNSNINFGNASRLWAKVKPSDVEGWNRLGDSLLKTDNLGNTFSVRGLDIFKHINRNMVEIGEDVLLSAPKKVFPKQLIAPEFEISASSRLSDIRLFFKSPFPKNSKVIIYATPMLKPGRNSPKPSKYRIIAVIDHTFLSGSSLFNEYQSIFPVNPENSNRIAFKIKSVSVISGLTIPEFALLQAPDSQPYILKNKPDRNKFFYRSKSVTPKLH